MGWMSYEAAETGELIRWWMTLAFALAAMAFELRTKHIPNALVLGGLLPAIAVAFFFGRGVDALYGGLLAFVPAYSLFRRGGLGGGVVKTALLLGISGGAVVGASLGAVVLLMALTVLTVDALLKRGLWPRDWNFVVPPVATTPTIFVITLIGLVLRHLLAAPP